MQKDVKLRTLVEEDEGSRSFFWHPHIYAGNDATQLW